MLCALTPLEPLTPSPLTDPIPTPTPNPCLCAPAPPQLLNRTVSFPQLYGIPGFDQGRLEHDHEYRKKVGARGLEGRREGGGCKGRKSGGFVVL